MGGRFGTIKLHPYDEENYLLTVANERYAKEIMAHKNISKLLKVAPDGFIVPIYLRGQLKIELIKLNLPVEDLIPLKRRTD